MQDDSATGFVSDAWSSPEVESTGAAGESATVLSAFRLCGVAWLPQVLLMNSRTSSGMIRSPTTWSATDGADSG